MKVSFIIVFLSLLFISACNTQPIENSTAYDGMYVGKFNCGSYETGVSSKNPYVRVVKFAVQRSRITDMHFDFSELDQNSRYSMKEVYPKDYFLDENTVAFDVSGGIKSNKDAYLLSEFVQGRWPRSLSLYGEIKDNILSLKGTIQHAVFTRSCQLTANRIEALPVVAKAPQTAFSGLKAIDTKRFGNYHALVIGVNQYKGLPDLQSAVFDAEVIAKTLTDDYGFKTTLLKNPSRSDIIKSLSFYRKNLLATENLLVYYAGHGWLDKEADQGYWLPADASKDDESNWLSNATLTASLRAIPAKHVMVVSDSCYSGKLVRGLKMTNRNSGYLEKMIKKKVRTVMTSGGLEPVLDKGGKDNHSIFASAFLNALKTNQGVMEGNDLFSEVRRPVAVNSDQTPEYADIHKAGHEGGDFLFVRINPDSKN